MYAPPVRCTSGRRAGNRRRRFGAAGDAAGAPLPMAVGLACMLGVIVLWGIVPVLVTLLLTAIERDMPPPRFQYGSDDLPEFLSSLGPVLAQEC